MTKTNKEVLQGFGLDWTAEKQPFTFKGNDNEIHETDYFGLVRSDNNFCLGHCKGSYRPFQNLQILEAMQDFAKANKLTLEKAGSLGGGKKVFLQLLIPDALKIGNSDVKQYIFAANTFDHSSRLCFGYTNVVVSCENTFNRMLKDRRFGLKHTQAGEAQITNLPLLFDEHFKLRQETNDMFAKWESTPLTDELSAKMVAYITGTDIDVEREEMSTKSRNILESIEMSIDREVKEKGKSLWGLFNGITYFANHEKTAPKRENGRLESILVGTGSQMMDKAVNFLQEVTA